MVSLGDGRVLAAGGAEPDGSGEPVPARDEIWIRDEAGNWSPLGTLAVARTGHGIAALPDGTVLLAGGTQSMVPFAYPEDPLSCVEIVDPTSGNTASLGDCDASDDSAGLVQRSGRPMVAVDPDWGVLIVGGLSGSGVATSGVQLYVPPRDAR